MTITFDLADIKTAAAKVFTFGAQQKVWAIHGEMGAGKTTFIHALCDNLGVTTAVGSPTYAIINEYISPAEGTLYHMDWYRLKDEEEALQAGVEDCLFSGNRCFVEWPERAALLLPDDCLHITLKIVNEQTRQCTILQPD